MKLTKGNKPRNTKGVCRRCGGSGNLLRPIKTKLLNFKKCTSCRGNGVRYQSLKSI